MITAHLHGAGFAYLELSLREPSEGSDFLPTSWAKICPYCLARWATLDCHEGVFSLHSTSCTSCKSVWDPRNIPGSIIFHGSRQTTDWDLLEDLPYPLVSNEFALHYQYLRNLSMLTPEDLSKLQLYRSRLQAGEMLPLEETKEAIRLLRSDRMTAATRAKASKAKGPKKAPSDGKALLEQLGIPGLT